jgi:hypothetical protein
VARKRQGTFAEAAKVERVWVHFPATQADGGQAMWNALAHLAGPTILTAAIAALGTSVRAVFRYPHMWRYLEFRCTRCIRPPGTAPRCDRSRCCLQCTRQCGEMAKEPPEPMAHANVNPSVSGESVSGSRHRPDWPPIRR